MAECERDRVGHKREVPIRRRSRAGWEDPEWSFDGLPWIVHSLILTRRKEKGRAISSRRPRSRKFLELVKPWNFRQKRLEGDLGLALTIA